MEKFFWDVTSHVENLPDRKTEKKSRLVVFGPKRPLQIIWHDVMASKKCENDASGQDFAWNMRDMLFLDVFNQTNFKYTPKKTTKYTKCASKAQKYVLEMRVITPKWRIDLSYDVGRAKIAQQFRIAIFGSKFQISQPAWYPDRH